MKVEELNPNSAVNQIAVVRADKPEPADAHGEAAAKQQQQADKVELTSYIPDVSSKQRRDANADRVQQLRSQIQSGTYQVPGRAVAEKMLSKIVVSSGR